MMANLTYRYNPILRNLKLCGKLYASYGISQQRNRLSYTEPPSKEQLEKWIKDGLSKNAFPFIIDEDATCIVFHEKCPQAPIHFLVVAKKRLKGLDACTEEDAGLLAHMLLMGKTWGSVMAPEGYRVVVNKGSDGYENVDQLHLHILGGRQLNWPPG